MKEEMSLTQVIAEEKNIQRNLLSTINQNDFKLISYCLNDRQFVGPRTMEEQIKYQKETLQSINDQIRRLQALKKAHIKANNDTKLTVPCEPDLIGLVNGKELGTEEISIAEAINRKNQFKFLPNQRDKFTYEFFANQLTAIYAKNFKEYDRYDEQSKSDVYEALSKKFPAESKTSWSQEKYNEQKKIEEEAHKVIRIDPNELIASNAITKYLQAIRDYIARIDSLISEVNASTKVTIEY